jgi:hypothetical protein
VAENEAQLPMKPRWCGALCSTRKMIDVVYSPPTDAPWIMRSRINTSGASEPICA